MLNPLSHQPLPPSPPYSGEDSPSPAIVHLIPPNGISTPDRTPSLSSSFGETLPHNHSGPSHPKSHNTTDNTKRQTSTSDGSSKGSRKVIATLEDFQLIRVLGKGCAGRVLLVKYTPTNTIRAMKAISKRSVLTHNEMNHTLTEQSILRKFAVEEPNNRFISKLHNSFTDRENFYFVMEFYPGGDLATQMEIHGVLGDHRTRFYAADITQGLEDLHRHGIIDRDLKPENILLNAKGHAVLADFGLSKEFLYRGDPKPIHVVTYPGQHELPPWAGKGAGSLRELASGQKKLIIDKAYSFVGTSEYLSPEVVKRGDYSYAVDWWALGCIVLEGLVGRVPFRKADDEPPMILWNRILCDPWDELFLEPKMARFMPDPVTYSFIDALLQKDPMWRLTEPCVKQHDYFSLLDWDTVKKGEYKDPHGLHLHPVAEYNTRYFPKLCLEEDPSVDMSTHDIRGEDHYQKTPLNDNILYALEQAKYRKELADFAWSRDEDGYETVEESELELEESVAGEEPEAEEPEQGLAELGLGSIHDTVRVSVEVLPAEVEGGPSTMEIERMSNCIEEMEEQKCKNEEDLTIIANITTAVDQGVQAQAGSPLLQVEVQPDKVASAIDSANNVPLKPSGPTTSPEGIVAQLLQTAEPKNMHQLAIADLQLETPDSSCLQQVEKIAQSTLPEPKALPSTPLPLQLPVSPKLSSQAIQTRPIPIPLRPKPVRQLSEEMAHLNLPTGLPSSGLSVSDIVNVPSPNPGSVTRVLRRHPQLPSEDTIPIARLSVELHGVRTYIDDEDWEELIPDPINPNASEPNGGGYSFLGKVLRRRPSTLVGSGLRRQTKNSDLSSTTKTSNYSPTKSNAIRPVLFSTQSIENTKKAFGLSKKIKTFPKFKSLTSPPLTSSLSNRTHPILIGNGIPHIQNGNNGFKPPLGGRRHTESGWFNKRSKKSSSTPKTQHPSSGPSSPIRSPQSVSPKSSLSAASAKGRVSVSTNDNGLPTLQLDDVNLNGNGGGMNLDWEPFDGSEWGVK
ncbi:uncharacterized protein IL334_006511 [Kwoniella shivajii]|uniref:non-specific serine/threonine protein kinase n=1 Tax=Kwoniella shivajii TaxID=564305 RepID=A0ABZ1D7S9_9TREE|nr:hypothetical protein IL334_006511 [Kwoniella shivajii]